MDKAQLDHALDVLRRTKERHTTKVLVGVFGGAVSIPGRLVIHDGEFILKMRVTGDKLSAIARGAMKHLPDALQMWHVQKMPRGYEASLKLLLDMGTGRERVNLGGTECRKVVEYG